MFTREQDMQFDFHRTPTYQVVEGGVEFGRMTAMNHDVVSWMVNKKSCTRFYA